MIRSNQSLINNEHGSAWKNFKIMELIGNFRLIIICLTITSILAYLVVVNRTNTMGYEIAEMQVRIQDLKEKQRDLSSKSTELQSMQRIKELSNNLLSMVQADNYDYLPVDQTSVAAK